jgi:serine/threonine-protein kinase
MVLQKLRNDQFPEISFSLMDRHAYRRFAEELCEHITKIECGTNYFDDLARIKRQLSDAYQRFMLEETVPDCALVTRCFIDGTYYYRKAGFTVGVVKDFLRVLTTCTAEQGRVLLANLHTRLDALPRYSDQDQTDIPF